MRFVGMLGIVGLAVLLVFGSAEAGFRLLPQVIPAHVCQSDVMINFAYCKWYYAYDTPPVLGYTYRPGYQYNGVFDPADPMTIQASDITCTRSRDDAFAYSLVADEHGFVNESPWQAEYDIVISGDSFTQQFAPVWWVEELENQTGYSILNLGMPGWGTLSSVKAIREYGLDKNPEWVVLVFFEGNDLFNISIYEQRWNRGISWRDYELEQASAFERLVTPHVVDFWLEELSGKNNPPAEGQCRYPVTINSNVDKFETVFVDAAISQLSLTQDEIAASTEWEAFTTEIRHLNADVQAQGGQFLLVFAPAKEHIYWGMMWDDRDIGNFLLGTWPSRSFDEFNDTVEAQSRLVESFAADNDILFLNLTTTFWLTARNEGEVYNYADSHWNSRGNQLTADTIAQFILEHASRE